MMDSKCVWASNVYYLNDSEEILHACKVLERGLLSNIAFRNENSVEAEFLRQVKEWIGTFRADAFNLFVFSLSEAPSLLSQWRSYTPHGKGVSLGFAEKTLNGFIRNSNLKLAKCLYQPHEHREVLDGLVEKLLITFNADLPNIDTTKHHPSQCYFDFLESFRGEVLQVLSIIKHKAFEEEREWRLISPYFSDYRVPQIKFRAGASMVVPYIELNFGKLKPYFEKIIIGPSAYPNLSMSALGAYMTNRGICDCIVNSNIPYREW